MSKESFVFVIGVIVFFTPFLGIPGEYRKWILIVCGIILMGIGYRLRRTAFLKSLEHESGERRGDTFVESKTMQKEMTPAHKDSVDVPS